MAKNTKLINATIQITKLNLSHTPDVMSKYMQIINDEADRILKIPVCGRSSTDIRTSIACLTALNSMNKDLHTEVREMRKEMREIPTGQLQTIAIEQRMPELSEFNDNLPEEGELVDSTTDLTNNSATLTTDSTAETCRPSTISDQHPPTPSPYQSTIAQTQPTIAQTPAIKQPFDPFGRTAKQSGDYYLSKIGSYPK